MYIIFFANFPVIPASIAYGISRIFRTIFVSIMKDSSGMSHVCIDSNSYSRNICAAIDTASQANTCAGKRRGDCSFWSDVSVQPAGTEYEDGLDEGKEGNKHLRAPQARIIFRDFSKMRRRGSRGRQSTRGSTCILIRCLCSAFSRTSPLFVLRAGQFR